MSPSERRDDLGRVREVLYGRTDCGARVVHVQTAGIGESGGIGAEISEFGSDGARGVPTHSPRTEESEVPQIVFVGVADGRAGGVDRERLAVRDSVHVDTEVIQLGGRGAGAIPADSACSHEVARVVLVGITGRGSSVVDSEGRRVRELEPPFTPRLPSSTAAMPVEFHRTARSPFGLPETSFSAKPTAVPEIFTA